MLGILLMGVGTWLNIVISLDHKRACVSVPLQKVVTSIAFPLVPIMCVAVTTHPWARKFLESVAVTRLTLVFCLLSLARSRVNSMKVVCYYLHGEYNATSYEHSRRRYKDRDFACSTPPEAK